jgi:DNA-binding NarL/FixJ family response regulator
MSVQVAIVEDDARVCAALARLVNEAPGFECSGTYGSGEEALASLARHPPQAVLMDVHLPRMSGVECVARLKQAAPSVEIIMLTVYEDADLIFKALQAGASGYLLKRSAPEEILKAIEDVRSGGAPMSSSIARKVVQSFFQKEQSPRESENLSPREEEVLAYVAKGYINKEIADMMSVSVETVRSHLKSVYEKLHVRSRTAAAFKYFGGH